MDNKIDNWAKEAFQDREITPRPQVWDALEQALDQVQPAPVKKPNKPYLTIMIAVLAGLAGVMGYYAVSPDNGREATRASFSQEIESPKVKEQTKDKSAAEASNSVLHTSENQSQESFSNERPVKVHSREATHHKVHFIHEKNKPSTLQRQQKQENTEPKKQEVDKTEKVFAQQVIKQEPAVSEPVVAYQDEATSKEIQKTGTNKFDAKKLLAEVQHDMATQSKKYLVNPKELLRVAEKENNETFLQKMLKQVSEKSTSVIAMVNNRNVEP